MTQSTEYDEQKAAEAHAHPEPLADTRPALQLPGEITVLGHRYRVEVIDDPDVALGRTDQNDHDALGLTDLNRGYIRIRGGGEQSEDAVRDTILHETLHAVAYLAGAHITEEQLGPIATVLLHTLRTNPLLVAALISR